ncbi:Ion-translocating oxidoreductase complex subunit B [subsurface metagenome]
MKEIVVISGKGGTGKTSIVASFAVLSQNAVIADCDVDAADLYLVLNPEVQITEPFSGGKIAEIIPERCTNCGECEQVCRFDAISEKVDGGTTNYTIDPVSCEGCGVCVAVCPAKAISFEPHENGELFVSSTKYGPMVHAKLGIAEDNSGKLVSLVRARAKVIAEDNGRDLIIVDGPPGVGCPVISSITGAHAVLIVTEPTVSGVHDLERVMKLTTHFNIPTYVCINKHDINPEVTQNIEDRAKSLNITVLGKIHYDPVITKAQIHAVPIVEYCQNKVSQEITTLWTSLYKCIL